MTGWFDYYKENVSIVQVAEALGYVWNKKAGRRPLEYKHPDYHTIVISQRKGRQLYFTRHESENRGSVIDFVLHRLPLFNVFYTKEMEGIQKVLSQFADIPYVDHHQKMQDLHEVRQPFDPGNFNVVQSKVSDLRYLTDRRGLTAQTVQAFLPFIRLVKENGYSIQNIGFPYRISPEGDVAGYELVNYLFKGHARGSNKSQGLWVADLSSIGKLSRHIYAAESALDGMSFFQLYRQKYPLDERTFLSTGGYVTDHQIRNMIRMFPNARIHTLFDNDLSGHLYDIRMACMKDRKWLSIKKDKERVHFKMNGKELVLPVKDVSLTLFRKEMGIRPGISVHKASAKDFNEMLMERSGQSLQQKSGF